MGSRVLSAWSYDPRTLNFVREYCQQHPSYDATQMDEVQQSIWQHHIQGEADIILFDRHPRAHPFVNVWTSKSPYLVIVSQGPDGRRNAQTQTGWHLQEMEIHHSDLGGVTTSNRRFSVYAKDSSMLRLIATHLNKVMARSLKQDLRCVLKAGLAGLPTRPTEWDLSEGYKSEVRYLYTGVISSAGLLPYPAPKRLRVSTVLGGNVWVKRPIQSSEVLAAMDVPEQMTRTRNIHLSAEELLLMIDTPVKMLQGLAESVKLASTFEEPNPPNSK